MDNTKKLSKILKDYFRLYDRDDVDVLNHKQVFLMEQNREELAKVLDYLGDRKFNNFVELGGSYGGSFWVYANALCSENATVIATDRNINRHGLAIVGKALTEQGKNAQILFEDNVVAAPKINIPIDLLHIDAFHTYEAIKKDYELYANKVIKGGVILFHDAVMHPGVTKFLREINVTNIMKSTAGFCCGIGILEK